MTSAQDPEVVSLAETDVVAMGASVEPELPAASRNAQAESGTIAKLRASVQAALRSFNQHRRAWDKVTAWAGTKGDEPGSKSQDPSNGAD